MTLPRSLRWSVMGDGKLRSKSLCLVLSCTRHDRMLQSMDCITMYNSACRTAEEKLRELTLALQEMKRQRLYEQEAQQTKPSVKASKTPSNKCPCALIMSCMHSNRPCLSWLLTTSNITPILPRHGQLGHAGVDGGFAASVGPHM